MKRVLVAGASGYAGKYLIKALKEKGYWVRALVRNREKLWKRGSYLEPAVGAEVDEILVVDLTNPHHLQYVCHNIDVVYSTLGMTTPQAGFTHEKIDYQANKNLLQAALAYSVSKFVFLSFYKKNLPEDLPALISREKFVNELQHARITSCVVRPNSFFSNMTPFLQMAQQGRIYLPSNTPTPLNPIHGRDLAKTLLKAMIAKEKEIALGGPETFRFEDIAQLAFKTLEKDPKITRLPQWSTDLASNLLKPFSPRASHLLELTTSALADVGVAPSKGKETLEQFFKDYAQSPFFKE